MTVLTIVLSRPARMIVNNTPSKTSTPLCPEESAFEVLICDCFSARFSDWLSSFLCHPSILGKQSETESGKLNAGEIVEDLRIGKRKDARSGSVLRLSAFGRMRNGRLLRNLKARPRLRLRYGLRTHVERSGLRGEKQNDIIKRRGDGVPR